MPAIHSNTTVIPSPLNSPTTTISVPPSAPTRLGLDNLFADSFSRTSTRAADRTARLGTIAAQRRELEQLASFLKRDAFEIQGPLRGFSHAYYNTIQGHLEQLDNNEFSDPEVTNHFAIDFAKRYRRNIEALEAKAAGDTRAQPEAHWVYAWDRAEELSYVPFLPEAMEKSAHILLGKTAHIDYDLAPSLSAALEFKVERDGAANAPARSLEADFRIAGAHFETTTDRTADELGLPDLIATIGNYVSDVPTHRMDRFEEWAASHEPTPVTNNSSTPSFFDLGW